MRYLLEEEELTTESDFSEVLAEIPSSLLLINLKEQIKYPLVSPMDLLTVFLDKCKLIREEYNNDSESIAQLNNLMSDFLTEVLDMIEDVYDISTNINRENLQELVEVTQALYKILILKYKKNLSKFFVKYILKNKKMLADEFGTGNSKDLTSLSLKKGLQIKNKESVSIISNLPLIFRNVASYQTEVEPVEFLELSGAEKYYEGYLLKEMFMYGKICGSFVPKIMELMEDHYDSEIFSEVRYKLIDKVMKK